MITARSIALAIITTSALVLSANAQGEIRIATVDVARIINEAPDAKAKKKELDAASEAAKSKIEAYAKTNNYDLVIDKSEKYRGPVLFGKPSADITDQILEAM